MSFIFAVPRRSSFCLTYYPRRFRALSSEKETDRLRTHAEDLSYGCISAANSFFVEKFKDLVDSIHLLKDIHDPSSFSSCYSQESVIAVAIKVYASCKKLAVGMGRLPSVNSRRKNHAGLTKYRVQCVSLCHFCNDNQRQNQFLITSGVRSNSFGQTAARRGLQSRMSPHDCFRCSIRRRTKRWCLISTSGTLPLSIQRIWDVPLIEDGELTNHLVIASRGCPTFRTFAAN